MIEAGEADRRIAEEIWIACKRDVLFFINVFCCIEEPRERGHASKVIPFITWPVQDWFVSTVEPYLGRKDLLTVKPRAFGATWLFLCFAVLHPWLFGDDRIHIGIASRDEQAVDNRDDPDSLFPKLDLLLEHLPTFLYDPNDAKRVTGKLVNFQTGSTIIGYSATGDLGRGGRKDRWLMDEFAAFAGNANRALNSTQFTTDCRMILSTIGEEPSCTFNVIAQDAAKPFVRVMPRWFDVPPYRAGLYQSTGGKLEVFDASYKFADDYPFVLDGKKRSPWYDYEESRSGSVAAMAREVDCSFIDGAVRAFPEARLAKIKETATEPTAVGMFEFDEEHDGQFYPGKSGPLSLWCKLIDGKPSTEEAYSLGVDISAGSGASNSVVYVTSRTSGKQVAEYVTAYDDPTKLASIATAIGRWFCGDEREAYLVFEANGFAGATFRDAIKKIGYRNLHRRGTDDEIREKRGKKLGFFTPGEGPGVVLSAYLKACADGLCENRSEKTADDFSEYVYAKGKIVHSGSASSDDETEGSATHGDRAVAAALSWHGCVARPRKAVEKTQAPPVPKVNSKEWNNYYLSDAWWEREDARRAMVAQSADPCHFNS